MIVAVACCTALCAAVISRGKRGTGRTLMTFPALQCAMLPAKGESGDAVIEFLCLHRSPPRRNMTRPAGPRAQLATMRCRMARRTVAERLGGKIGRRSRTFLLHGHMTSFTCNRRVAAHQREPRDGMIEPFRRLPSRCRVALAAFLRRKSLPMRRTMAGGAIGVCLRRKEQRRWSRRDGE